jgi:hypothetical protein
MCSDDADVIMVDKATAESSARKRQPPAQPKNPRQVRTCLLTYVPPVLTLRHGAASGEGCVKPRDMVVMLTRIGALLTYPRPRAQSTFHLGFAFARLGERDTRDHGCDAPFYCCHWY